jgi:hypothetical protein
MFLQLLFDIHSNNHKEELWGDNLKILFVILDIYLGIGRNMNNEMNENKLKKSN